MPNWCENRLTITGEKANIEAIEAKYIGEDGFTLDKVIPMPEELQHTQKGSESSLGEDLITGNYKHVVGMTWFKDMLKKGGVDAPR